LKTNTSISINHLLINRLTLQQKKIEGIENKASLHISYVCPCGKYLNFFFRLLKCKKEKKEGRSDYIKINIEQNHFAESCCGYTQMGTSSF